MNQLGTSAACVVLLGATGAVRAAPPVEMTQMLKSMAGTWHCTGTAPGPGGTPLPLAGNWKTSAELDGTWARDAFDGTLGSGKAASRYRLLVFTTYDPATRTWRELALDNAGGSRVGTSEGMKDLKMTVEGELSGGHGAGLARAVLDMSNLKKGAHRQLELSRDRGASWSPVYDLVCKR